MAESTPARGTGTIPLHCCGMTAWVVGQEREVDLAGRMKDAGALRGKIAELLEVNEKTVRLRHPNQGTGGGT